MLMRCVRGALRGVVTAAAAAKAGGGGGMPITSTMTHQLLSLSARHAPRCGLPGARKRRTTL